MEFNWITKIHAKTDGQLCDVVIKHHNTDARDKYGQTAVSFKRGTWSKITTNFYVVFAVIGTRLYFKQGDVLTGYKLSTLRQNNQTVTCKVNARLLPTNKNGVEEGMYNLEFDNQTKLYYIDVKHRLRGE